MRKVYQYHFLHVFGMLHDLLHSKRTHYIWAIRMLPGLQFHISWNNLTCSVILGVFKLHWYYCVRSMFQRYPEHCRQLSSLHCSSVLFQRADKCQIPLCALSCLSFPVFYLISLISTLSPFYLVVTVIISLYQFLWVQCWVQSSAPV